MSKESTNKPSKLEALENIRQLIFRVEQAKQARKTAAEMVSDHLEANESYKAVELAKIALDEAKERLFKNLAADEEYIGLRDSYDTAKYELGIEQEILATEVLAYRETFEAKAVEIDEQTERPIILKASLGKKQDIQLELGFDGKTDQAELDV